MKKYLLAFAGLLSIVLVVGGIKAQQISTLMNMMANMQMPPTAITASEVRELEWEESLQSVGSLEAVRGVTVNADMQGRVTEILFTAGTDVKKGDVLIRQESSTEEAQLRAAEASADLAKVNLDRLRALLASNVSSKAEYDAAEARYKESVAQADNIRSIIAKKTVRAPFDGRLGIRMVNIGSDLNSGSPIVSLQAVDPIYVNFQIPQRSLSSLQKGLQVRLTTDAVPNATFNGLLTAISPEVDVSTRSVRVQATLENTGGKLLPGMYAKVQVVLPEVKRVLAVPATAISYATYGDSIFKIVENDEGALIAEQSFVRLGEARGDFVEILAGVEAGDRIVTTGVFKLLNGAAVSINNDTQPEYSETPNPENS